mgnify:CR=1 FL=1
MAGSYDFSVPFGSYCLETAYLSEMQEAAFSDVQQFGHLNRAGWTRTSVMYL